MCNGTHWPYAREDECPLRSICPPYFRHILSSAPTSSMCRPIRPEDTNSTIVDAMFLVSTLFLECTDHYITRASRNRGININRRSYLSEQSLDKIHKNRRETYPAFFIICAIVSTTSRMRLFCIGNGCCTDSRSRYELQRNVKWKIERHGAMTWRNSAKAQWLNVAMTQNHNLQISKLKFWKNHSVLL